jgi:fucose 4-O-acetylase-like acetyltransferase
MATLRSAAQPRVGAVAERESRVDRPVEPTGSGGRDPWFDNIKMTLVTLVVVGHAWTLLPHNLLNDWAYDFLYAWHIPAFVILTGYLSRSFTWTVPKLSALVRTVALPYLVFEAALAWFRYQVGGIELDDLFTDPHWPMWYLAALFFWRLSAPVFTALRPQVALPLAVTISLVAGLQAGDTLDAARILGLLPFFVLGLKLDPGHWRRLRESRLVPWALAGIAMVLVATWFTDDWIATEWYYYRSRYDVLEPDDPKAMTIRLVLLTVGLLGALCVFVLVPRAKTWFSSLGAATLVVYLFHGFFVLGAQYEGYPDWAAAHAGPAFLLTTIAAVALAVLLAAPPVARRLTALVDPIGWLDRRRRRRRPEPAPDPRSV